jgi:filamentous hemagglutinin family protein
MLFNVSLPVILAGPVKPTVVEGAATFDQSGNTTTITTATNQTIINYDSFDVFSHETANFIQPYSSSNVLNRINSAQPTALDGTILSNGGVYWLNPAGVIIGEGAYINVSKFIAAAHDMSNSDFLNGVDRFAGGSGIVENRGQIIAETIAALVGGQVTNTGSITCPDGYVVMAAGDNVLLGQSGSDVFVEISSPEAPDKPDFQLTPQVTNEGTVDAAGGKIILAVAGDAFARPMMANLGSLSTSAAEGDAGDIILQAGDGQIDNTGSITAQSDSGAGGTVTATASEVVNSGTVDVSGAQGGTVAFEGAGRVGQFGTIHADGTQEDGGNVNLTAGGIVALAGDSLTTANAGNDGDGGEVIIYSPKAALFQQDAQVEAKGGTQAGDGGFFEVSGHEYVEVEGQVDLTAANGETGNFLIDPRDIKIVSDASQGHGVGWGDWDPITGELLAAGSNTKIRIGYLETYLDTTNVIMSTGLAGSDGPKDGDITFKADRDLQSGRYWTGEPGAPTAPSDNSLTIIANHDITFQSGSGIDFAGSGDVILKVVNNVVIDGDISLDGGSFSSTHIESDELNPGTAGVDFDNHFQSSGMLTTSGGSVNIDHLGDVTIGAAIDTTGGAGNGSVEIGGSSITVGDNIYAGDNITFYGLYGYGRYYQDHRRRACAK